MNFLYRVIFIILFTVFSISSVIAEEPRYGSRVQVFNTEVGKLELKFRDVRDTWRTYPEPFTEIEFKTKQAVYSIDIDLVDDIPLIELKTPDNRYKIAIIFVDINGAYTRSKMYARLICIDPISIIKTYYVAKPEFKEYYYKEVFKFPKNFKVDLHDDIFINGAKSIEKLKERIQHDYILSLKPLPKEVEALMGKDKNNDCIIDEYQLSTINKERTDKNNDGINDAYQTKTFYNKSKMTTFYDLNNDGLCDNYNSQVFNCQTLTADYSNIEIDLRKDIFQNKAKADSIRLSYIDQNLDGINDVFQNSKISVEAFSKGYPVKVESFVDVNHDSINDIFQTIHFYNIYSLNTFIDLDGDGLSDTYVKTK